MTTTITVDLIVADVMVYEIDDTGVFQAHIDIEATNVIPEVDPEVGPYVLADMGGRHGFDGNLVEGEYYPGNIDRIINAALADARLGITIALNNLVPQGRFPSDWVFV